MSGLDNMKKRLRYEGGKTSDGRFNTNKLKSFQYALWHSYQAEWITIDRRDTRARCLINPEKNTVDYEQKIISIERCFHLKPGDTFYWNRTGRHWIVYDEYHEEEAYFRARIRRCDYQIECNGEKYWIYLRGPVETALVWRQKHQLEFNDLNYSLMFYITKNEDTKEFFSRHQVVKFDGHNWKVAATDKYSQDGVIEVYLEEYFDNEMEDAMIAPEIVKPNIKKPYIDGPQIVRPYDTNLVYSIVGSSDNEFVVNSSKVKIIEQTNTSCTLEIISGKSGNFVLSYGDIALNVTIKSL